MSQDTTPSAEELDKMRAVARMTVDELLIRMGIDVSDPIEMQKDFQHLRDWRTSTESIKKKSVLTLVGILITGMAGALWLGFKSFMHLT